MSHTLQNLNHKQAQVTINIDVDYFNKYRWYSGNATPLTIFGSQLTGDFIFLVSIDLPEEGGNFYLYETCQWDSEANEFKDGANLVIYPVLRWKLLTTGIE